MNITIVIDSLKDDLSATAEIGDERVAAVARRLGDTLGASLRLRLLDLLSQFVSQVTTYRWMAVLRHSPGRMGVHANSTRGPESIEEARESLLMSAYWKIPLQALVLLVGVFMFLYYLFAPAPMLFNRAHERELRCGDGWRGHQRFSSLGGAGTTRQASRAPWLPGTACAKTVSLTVTSSGRLVA